MRTLQLNQNANNDLKGQTFPSAMEKYLEALRYDPFVGALHLNLGLSFEGLQQAEKALASYKEAETLALKEQNQELVFMARFNQAQLLGKAKRIDEALSLYQKALEIIPTSKEVKTNIELLTQGEGGGNGGENQKDQKDQSGDQQKDQNKDGQGDQNKDKEQDQEQKDEKKEMKQSPKYKPRPFQGKELSEADVKKILGELKQQEEKIRAEYNKKEVKEQPRDKDW
ncbi:tetratricopeptide repeat protein [Bdellovibrio reynosensis]|uniref:Tetratricopeptide repeat protein n=1 Tax=Bdellovibrio reynosensis TaxID=2835041 RepID=A0ABY4CGQ3_9BACT|nr:tetratricopeptide repeat protein [Bdellovibrio reynosensis]UOF01390.1 tetratricopeptide repeat protein [Bdellovibrio reynosensis]